MYDRCKKKLGGNMDDFRQLVESDHAVVGNYLKRHEMESPELYHRYLNLGIKRDTKNRKSGWFYGYFSKDQLEGVFLFTNNQMLLCHYTNKTILDRVILLKAIKHHKPRFFMGAEEFIQPLWELVRKTVVDCKYIESLYMVCNEVERLNDFEELDIPDLEDIDDRQLVSFLMEVEKAFGRPVTMVQSLKENRIKRALETHTVFVQNEGRLMAQGLIEFKTESLAQIGGIYVNPNMRKRGIGEAIVKKLCVCAKDLGKTPTLIVERKNTPAVKLYEKLGFKPIYKHITLEVTYQ